MRDPPSDLVHGRGALTQPSRSSQSHIRVGRLKMQLINAPEDTKFPAIEAAIHSERLTRYLPAAGMNKKIAFDFYMWNCLICESFHLSLHFAEIICRNTLHSGLTARCGMDWYNHVTFRKLLSDDYLSELDSAVANETKQHRAKMTTNHVVSALTFGFWEHLTTKRFERFLWAKGIPNVFPNAPATMQLIELHNLIESVRRWRNRIAHHRAIFDKGPMKKHQDALRLIEIACNDTQTWVSSASRLPQALTLRPNQSA